jgi:hypothetical protein
MCRDAIFLLPNYAGKRPATVNAACGNCFQMARSSAVISTKPNRLSYCPGSVTMPTSGHVNLFIFFAFTAPVLQGWIDQTNARNAMLAIMATRNKMMLTRKTAAQLARSNPEAYAPIFSFLHHLQPDLNGSSHHFSSQTSDQIIIDDRERDQRNDESLKGNLRRPSELFVGVVM